ncbi:MAG TPA: hypothetical protein VH482_02745 [Thermomicrobiales bacterium]
MSHDLLSFLDRLRLLARFDGFVGGKEADKDRGRQDLDFLIGTECQEVLIAGNDMVGVARNRAFEYFVVVGIGGDYREALRRNSLESCLPDSLNDGVDL